MSSSEVNNGLQVDKARSGTMHKSMKQAKVESDDMAGELKITRSASMTDKRVRYDRNGNPITTVIGAFSVETRRLLVKQKKLATLRQSGTSDTGNSEISPLKGAGETVDSEASPVKDKKKRHRVTFADDISGDKKKLTEVH